MSYRRAAATITGDRIQMTSRREFYVAKANYCTMMAQQLAEDERQNNWLALATEWLSLAEADAEFERLRGTVLSGADPAGEAQAA